MPGKGKKQPQPTAGKPTQEKQYEMEYRIWIDISNAMYEANTRVEGNKSDKRVWAAFKGLDATPTGISRERRNE